MKVPLGLTQNLTILGLPKTKIISSRVLDSQEVVALFRVSTVKGNKYQPFFIPTIIIHTSSLSSAI